MGSEEPLNIQGSHVLIPHLPYRAWRFLLDFLRLDEAFCNSVFPYFHRGYLTLYIYSMQNTREPGVHIGKDTHHEHRHHRAIAAVIQANSDSCGKLLNE